MEKISSEIEKEYGNVVKKIVTMENNAESDEYVGYTDGINAVLQNKNYVYSNAKWYEESCKKGIYDQGHLGCSLMLYYLKQEPDFDEWYIDQMEKWIEIRYHLGY